MTIVRADHRKGWGLVRCSGDALFDRLEIGTKMHGGQCRERASDDLGLGVPEEPLGAAIPRQDVGSVVLAEQREARQIGEDVEHRSTSDFARAALATLIDEADHTANELVDSNAEDRGGGRISAQHHASAAQFEHRNVDALGLRAHRARTYSNDSVPPARPRRDCRRAPCRYASNGRTVRTMADIGDCLAVTALNLARRFGRGATMWCFAPQWPEHARHVAVEFVHPVVVGKRALPAVSIDAADPVAALRALVRAGDVILVMSRSDDPTALAVVRRAVAWGATTIWMGCGPRPADKAADHIVWAEDEGDDARGSAVHDGRLVLLYHVLWELTHVCFEHPGLLTTVDDADCIDGEVCITCSDEGRVGEVINTDGAGSTLVRTSRGIETIDTTIVAVVAPGDLVLIHAGAAIAEVP